LGKSPFVSQEFDIDMDDDIFISLREINEIRRLLVDRLTSARMKVSYDPVIREVEFSQLSIPFDNSKSCSVFSEEQLKTCLQLGYQRIYVNDYSLFQKYQ